ncbi:MAG: SLBB domain-containing protein [Candidatus Loosdrechtia sp.]|uniref:SLBB domain-containing protein n=1 Tax=Candidatus Loosdrechtia sp. TaxID=3101272 RepID=UPI003A68404F|nr:MAG: SLBB domain-containing protein [Candidatus Jettenia sp. AMX2]
MIKKIFTVVFIYLTVFIAFLPGYTYELRGDEQRQYKVGFGDVLDISVLNHSELMTKAPVTSDGSISFPYIGTIKVKDLTLAEVKNEITNRLSSYIKHPVVSVTMSKFESMKFYVYGEVRSPGRYTLEGYMTVIKAISTAGGITPDGLYGRIKLRRQQKGGRGYREIDIDLRNTMLSHMNGDVPVEDEDIIVVERNKEFFVYGEVARPGKFALEDNMTVLRAISFAGGFTKYGSPSRVRILRTVPNKTEYENIVVDMRSAMRGDIGKDVRLESGDIVIVSEGIL